MGDMLCFPNWRYKAFTMSYDDGVEQDIKLIEIMNKNGLKGTFNINTGFLSEEEHVYPKGELHRVMSKGKTYELYHNSGHEVAVHMLYHPFAQNRPIANATYQILQDKTNIEEMFGGVIRGSAYPFGITSDEVVDALKACGIVYARLTEPTHSFEIPQDWLRLKPTCHHNHEETMPLIEDFIQRKPNHAELFYLWGHSYEFERDNNWERIEEICKKIGGHDDIWYATNIEIYNYLEAYKNLRFNTLMTYVENPTDTDIYLEIRRKKYIVKAGEGINLD